MPQSQPASENQVLSLHHGQTDFRIGRLCDLWMDKIRQTR